MKKDVVHKSCVDCKHYSISKTIKIMSNCLILHGVLIYSKNLNFFLRNLLFVVMLSLFLSSEGP